MSRVARRTDSKEERESGCGRWGYTREARNDLRVLFAPSTRTAAMRACWSRRAGSMSVRERKPDMSVREIRCDAGLGIDPLLGQ